MKKLFGLLLAACCLLMASPALCAVIFADDFNDASAIASKWGNERGSWSVVSGEYNAGSPQNVPPTYSSALTALLTDFEVEIDVKSLDDGGIWLRSTYAASKASGVLLVTGGWGGAYDGLYWHVVTNDGYSSAFNYGPLSGLQGSDARLRIVVSGNDYSVFVNGAVTALTSFSTSLFSSGYVGLYDYSGSQRFDNIKISTNAPNPVPEPSSLVLILFGFGVALLSNRGAKGL